MRAIAVVLAHDLAPRLAGWPRAPGDGAVLAGVVRAARLGAAPEAVDGSAAEVAPMHTVVWRRRRFWQVGGVRRRERDRYAYEQEFVLSRASASVHMRDLGGVAGIADDFLGAAVCGGSADGRAAQARAVFRWPSGCALRRARIRGDAVSMLVVRWEPQRQPGNQRVRRELLLGAPPAYRREPLTVRATQLVFTGGQLQP